MSDEFSTDIVLMIDGISKRFGTKKVLDEVSFDVKSGEIFGLLGPNGSGKTTTIKLALNLLNLDSGEIYICGYNLKTDFEKAMQNVGAIIETPEFYTYMSGYENLKQLVRMYDNISEERIMEVASIVGLSERINDKVSTYSLGMKQRLGVAQSILHNPRLYLFDEPTNGLDPEGIKDFRDLIIKLSHEEGAGVLISSHLLSELDALCDRVGIINESKIVTTKTMEEIKSYGEAEKRKCIVSVSNPEKLLEYLSLKEYEYSSKNQFEFEIQALSKDSENLLSDMIMNGVVVKAFSLEEKTLENAFIDIIKESGGTEK